MNINDAISLLVTNLPFNTAKPAQISRQYSLAQGDNGGVGFIHPNGTVTFHDVTNNVMTVDHQKGKTVKNG